MKTLSGSLHAVVHQILSKSNDIFTGIWQFNDFQNGGRPPSWILKTCSFYHVAWRSASAYKISPKSDNRSMSYDQNSEFQDGGRRHLEFQKFHHVTVTGLNIWCSVPNFIKIGRFFTEIWRFNDFHVTLSQGVQNNHSYEFFDPLLNTSDGRFAKNVNDSIRFSTTNFTLFDKFAYFC